MTPNPRPARLLVSCTFLGGPLKDKTKTVTADKDRQPHKFLYHSSVEGHGAYTRKDGTHLYIWERWPVAKRIPDGGILV